MSEPSDGRASGVRVQITPSPLFSAAVEAGPRAVASSGLRVDMGKALSSITLKIRVVGMVRARARMFFGCLVLRLGAAIIGTPVEIDAAPAATA